MKIRKRRIFSDIHLASRTKRKCDAIAASVKERTGQNVATYEIDAEEVPAMVNLIRRVQPSLVLNLALKLHGRALDRVLEDEVLQFVSKALRFFEGKSGKYHVAAARTRGVDDKLAQVELSLDDIL